MQDDNIYKVIEVVGSSSESLDDAIRTGVEKAGRSVKHLRWFQVTDTRGHIEDGKVAHYQVSLKIGFRVDE
jgi:flavin-binding protein dodecin